MATTYKLKDICSKIGSGATPKGGKEAYLGGETTLIRSQNVLDFSFSNTGLAYINNEQATALDNVIVEKNDVLLNITGDSVARACMVPDDILPARVNQHVAIIRGNSSLVLNEYLLYYIQFIKSQLLSLSQGGATRNALTKGMIENIEIPLPSIREQKRIVSVLKSIQSKIEFNNHINHNLEEQAQALYKSWFVDFEPFKDGNFVKTEMGLIPEGWAVKQLGEVTNEMRDKVGNNKVTKVLSPINTGQLVLSEDFFTKQVYSESIAKYLIVKPGDFAYNPARVNIGSLGVNDFPFDGCVSPVYVVFRCENGYNYFFDLYRKTEPFKEEVLARSNGGVRQTLGYKDFALISLVYPPKCVIESFNSIYKSLLDIQKHNRAQINTLSEQRDTLLPLLMSGELSILDSNN